ncbi:MAG: hypothetical protein M1820_000186 [Bogoriella megaspora]|nr:MAG: hypothetical protein M1820_000186 [Bogoriella megaspora]
MNADESLSPDTAPSGRFIWESVDRAALERQTEALESKKHVPGRQVYADPPYLSDEDLYPLSFELERSLADDLAFIAASQPGVHSVSAIAVELDKTKSLLRVKLAANDGVCSLVKEAFDDLFGLLREHARKDMTRDKCQEKLFELIVRLNSYKIMGRLESTKFQPPLYLARSWEPIPLPARLRRLFRENCSAPISGRNRVDFDRLDDEIGRFEAAFRQLEKWMSSNELLPHVQNAVKEAYGLTDGGVNLPNRLLALGCPTSLLDAKVVREVGKVSNYWRISRSLAIYSQKFRPLFANAEWCPLIEYDDLKEYDWSTILHFRQVVSQVQKQVQEEYLKAQTKSPWRPFPIQSAININAVQLKTPSISTLLSTPGSHPSDDTVTIGPKSVSDISTARVISESLRQLSIYGNSNASSEVPPVPLLSDDRQVPRSEDGDMHIEKPVEISVDKTVSRHGDWVHILGSFSGSPNIERSNRLGQRLNAASISLESPLDDATQSQIRLADLSLGKELVVEKGPNGSSNELSFILIGPQDQKVRIRCQWHG